MAVLKCTSSSACIKIPTGGGNVVVHFYWDYLLQNQHAHAARERELVLATITYSNDEAN